LGQNEKQNTQQPKSQPNQLQNCQAVMLLSKVIQGCGVDEKKRLDHRNGKNSNVMVLNKPRAGQATKRFGNGRFQEIGVSVNPKRFGFSKNTRVDVSSARTVSYSTGKMSMSSNNIPTVK